MASKQSNLELAPENQRGELAWDVAHLFPPQGQWQEVDYFQLHSNRMGNGVYQDAGIYTAGQIAKSLFIPGFAIEIDRILELGK